MRGRTSLGEVAAAGALALLPALAPFAAHATEPPPACGFDVDRQTLAPYGDAAAAPQAAVWARAAGSGFVAYTVGRAGGRPAAVAVVQHCASGDELLVAMPQDEGAALHRWEDMVHGPGSHTLAAIGAEMEALGGRIRLSTGAIGTCVCDEFFGRN
jgi:hypothetical protein